MEQHPAVQPSKALSASQRDVAEYAVTGLSIILNQIGEGDAKELTSDIRKDFKALSEGAPLDNQLSERGWNTLQNISQHIADHKTLSGEQANNLLVVMAGVASAVSTAGLVSPPERAVEREAEAPQAEKRHSEQRQPVGRWTRLVQERQSSSALQRG